MADIGTLVDLIQSIHKCIKKFYDKHKLYKGNKEEVKTLQAALDGAKNFLKELKYQVCNVPRVW